MTKGPEEYLIRVGKGLVKDAQKLLALSGTPSHVRIGTLAPLSTYGYLPGVDTHLLKVDERGIVMGADGREDVPHEFVPWQNVSYVCDGTGLYNSRSAKAGAR